MKNPKTILVTGCAGFIGSNFVKTFKKEYPKTKIIGIDDFSTGNKKVVDSSVKLFEASILNKKLVDKIFSKYKPEYVFHFAALPRVSYSVKNPTLTTEVNILGTVVLLEAAKNNNVRRFIYSSSSSVYGGAKKLPTKESENPVNPKSPYALQKYTGEPFCKIFSELYDLDTACLRYFNVYGPGQTGNSPYSTIISAWLESLYFPKKNKAFIEGDGKQSRDFCYIENVVNANICAMNYKKKINGEVFNVGNGERIVINDVLKLIEKNTNRKLNLEKRPDRTGDVKHTHADISKIKKILGFKIKKNFYEGLLETIEWFEARKK